MGIRFPLDVMCVNFSARIRQEFKRANVPNGATHCYNVAGVTDASGSAERVESTSKFQDD